LAFRREPSGKDCDSTDSCRDMWQSQPDDKGQSKFRKYFVEPFTSSRNPPWFDARGVAVGLFIGLGIPVGTQMMVLGLLRLLFRFNTIIAFACTWVNNPVSIIPMYYGYYCLGSLMLGRPVIMSAEDFQTLMRPMLYPEYFWHSAQAFVYLGWDIVVRWSVAALTVSATCGLIGYLGSYRLSMKRCRRKAQRLGITYEKLLSELEGSVEKTENVQS
jgi:uncharacterized protein (DUF2062 family)